MFWEFYVDTTEVGADDDAFRVFDYTDERAFYGIKRSRANLSA